jgi:NAD(P)-dependent dehydrogenase (short-subunit alcohol dehydrogenase family)
MSKAIELHGKTASVTGAGSGLGKDIALGLAAKGYAVFGTAMSDTEIRDVLSAHGGGSGVAFAWETQLLAGKEGAGV